MKRLPRCELVTCVATLLCACAGSDGTKVTGDGSAPPVFGDASITDPGLLSCAALRAEWLSTVGSPEIQRCTGNSECYYVGWAYSCDIRKTTPISGDCGRVANTKLYATSRQAALEREFDSRNCGGNHNLCDCDLGQPKCVSDRCALVPTFRRYDAGDVQHDAATDGPSPGQ